MSTPTTGTPISTVQRAVYPSWVDLLFPEARTQQLLVQQNTLLAQLVESQGRVPRTGGLALPRGIPGGPARPAAGGPPRAVGPAPLLTQSTSPASLVGAYLSSGAAAYAQYVFQAVPRLLAPMAQTTFTYTVPTGQVLVLLAPLTANADLHSPTLTVSVTVDDVPLLVNRALTQNAGVLLAADAVVHRAVAVTYASTDADAAEVTTDLTGVLLDAQQFSTVIEPLLLGLYGGLVTQADTAATTTEAAS